MMGSMPGTPIMRQPLETDAATGTTTNAMGKGPALPSDGAKELQDRPRTRTIDTTRLSQETSAPTPLLKRTSPTGIITVTETGPALPSDGAKEPQDDLNQT